MTLPEYINCKSKTIAHCDYLMHTDCPSTCAYALDIGGVSVNRVKRTEKYVCRFFPCKTATETGRDCSAEESKSCGIKKLIEQYGENYLMMGCGSTMDTKHIIKIKEQVSRDDK